MAWWGLIEEEKTRRPDGGRGGFWLVTELGERWLKGEATVPKIAHHFNSKCLWLDGPPWSVHDAMGEHFDWRATIDGTIE